MARSKRTRPKVNVRRRNRQTILKAAEKVFAANGYNGATILEIANEANLPTANIHFYFATKKVLYRAVLENTYELWKQAADGFGRDLDPRSALEKYIALKMHIARTNPLGSKIWATEIIQGAPMVAGFLETEAKPWLDSCARTIRKWISDGRIVDVNPKTMMFMIWAVTQHYADFDEQIRLMNGGKKLTERQFDNRTKEITQVLLRGFGLSERCH